ncbi:MAG TPA: spherulation-specific family 4 protein [Planctomycetota bacterium]|jgi:hypothetical protein|nr:spherulation-specific family 4 protein [Planctomycetota bacterium]
MWCNRRALKVYLKGALFGLALLSNPGGSERTILLARTLSPRALSASAQAMAIPSYFPRTAQGAADWTTMCNAAPAVGIALANVNNGPDDGTHGTNITWANRITAAHNAGVLVLGYIYTGYADPTNPDYRTLSQAQTAVDQWYSWYGAIDGIFVDQTSLDPAKGRGPAGYYFQLAQYIRSKPGKHLIALGQGDNASDATYMADGDIIVNFEGTYATFASWSAASWTDGFDSGRFWHLVHAVPPASVADAVAHSRINNGGWVYVTTRSVDFWGSLPVTSDWRNLLENVQPLSRWRASNGAGTLQYRLQYANTWTYKRVYIDTDRATSTGYLHGGIGANFLIENEALYRYTGTGSEWSWSLVKPITYSTGGGGDGTVNWSRWDLSRSDLGSTTDTYLLFEVERFGGALKTAPYKYEHVYSATTPASITQYFGENDSTRFYFEAVMPPFWNFRQIFIDIDSNLATGFRMGGIGSDYLIENGNLYRYTGSGTNWIWSLVGWVAHPSRVGTTYDWWVWRADVKAPGNSGMIFNQGGARLLFNGNTGAPSYTTPSSVERFSP